LATLQATGTASGGGKGSGRFVFKLKPQ